MTDIVRIDFISAGKIVATFWRKVLIGETIEVSTANPDFKLPLNFQFSSIYVTPWDRIETDYIHAGGLT